MPGKYDRKDHLYRKAKEEGYRSRAAFKLIELDQSYRLLKNGYKSLDLGAWPGGWLQVVARKIGQSGRAIGVDLVPIDPLGLSNVQTLVGDAQDAQVLAKAVSLAGDKFDVILSDMSPKLSGIREADEARAVQCAQMALDACRTALKPGGSLVIKVFKSEETEAFVKKMRSIFNKLIRSELDASRKTSNEFYVIGHGYQG